MTAATEFDDAFRARLHDLFVWRRDVRRFRPDPLPPGTLERLIATACLAPSVGLSQPWRFVVVDDAGRRAAVREVFRGCNAEALAAYTDDAAAQYARLKLAGLDEAPVHFAVFADRDTATGRGLGRRTMPEMAEYSAVAAITTLWLAARADGIGLGWVSILRPHTGEPYPRRSARLAPHRLFLPRLSARGKRPPRTGTRRMGGAARHGGCDFAALRPKPNPPRRSRLSGLLLLAATIPNPQNSV